MISNKYIGYFKTFNNFYYLLTILVKRDFKKKYKGSVIGVLWSLLNPLLQVVLLTIIFSSIFNTNIHNFPLYVIIGRLIFEFFAAATNASMFSIIESGDLLKKVYIPKYIMPLAKIFSNFIILLISFIDLILIMIITKAPFTLNLIFVPIYLILLVIFTVGIGLILATIATFFRDVVHLYSVFIMMLMFACAIFYPAEIIPPRYKILLELNPLYQFIYGFRNVIYSGGSFDINNLIICTLVSGISFIVGVIIFEKNQNKFISYI